MCIIRVCMTKACLMWACTAWVYTAWTCLAWVWIKRLFSTVKQLFDCHLRNKPNLLNVQYYMFQNNPANTSWKENHLHVLKTLLISVSFRETLSLNRCLKNWRCNNFENWKITWKALNVRWVLLPNLCSGAESVTQCPAPPHPLPNTERSTFIYMYILGCPPKLVSYRNNRN